MCESKIFESNIIESNFIFFRIRIEPNRQNFVQIEANQNR